jgi:hypothetical protein
MNNTRADSPRCAACRISRCLAEGAFLKRFLAEEGSAESLQLLERLTKAGGQTKRIHRALFWFGSLFLITLAGAGYCAVLLPDVLFRPPHFVIKSLLVFCTVSLLCATEALENGAGTALA